MNIGQFALITALRALASTPLSSMSAYVPYVALSTGARRQIK